MKFALLLQLKKPSKRLKWRWIDCLIGTLIATVRDSLFKKPHHVFDMPPTGHFSCDPGFEHFRAIFTLKCTSVNYLSFFGCHFGHFLSSFMIGKNQPIPTASNFNSDNDFLKYFLSLNWDSFKLICEMFKFVQNWVGKMGETQPEKAFSFLNNGWEGVNEVQFSRMRAINWTDSLLGHWWIATD